MSWRSCSSTLRDSAASSWICCCICATSARCAWLRACAERKSCSEAGSVAATVASCSPSSSPRAAASSVRTPSDASSACASACCALPARVLGFELAQTLLDALAALDDVADALLEPAHLERGLGEQPLRRVQIVAGGVVRLAQRLEVGLDLAQLGDARLERVGRREHAALHTLLLGGRVAVLQEP